METDTASDTVRLFIALWPTPAVRHALHAEFAQALRALNLPVEPRPFRPHVTLARQATGGVPPTHTATLSWPVRGCALVQSAADLHTPIALYRCSG